MRHFLVSGFITAFLLGSVPAMAEADQRRAVLSSSDDRGSDRSVDRAADRAVDRGRVVPVHKKYLTSRYRDGEGHRDHRGDHRSRGHDRRVFGGKEHRGGHNGWKQDKRHHRKHGYHGQKRHWKKQHRSHDRHSGQRSGYGSDYRYRLHYNGLVGHGVDRGQIVIDLSRR